MTPSSTMEKSINISDSNLEYSGSGRLPAPIPRQRVNAIKDSNGVRFVFEREPKPYTLWQSTIQPLIAQCAMSYEAIATDSNLLGGIPRIAGTRLSVGQVLGRLYVHGSIEQVVAYYGGQVTTAQIKEAIAYAQDFIEAVCEPPDVNG
jgi:uncharacterized protein (DUF433 family)